MYKLFILLFCITFSFSQSIEIDKDTKLVDILSQSYVFLDDNFLYDINSIQKENVKFQKNEKSFLGFGYSPNFSVWVRFTLKNTSNDKITKIIEYENAMTTKVEFFSPKDNLYKVDGLLNIDKNRKSLTPVFTITLNPNESKTYYVRASSYITTLIIKLNLWDTHAFYSKEIQHQGMFFLFFGAMFILGLYNLFIYFYIKDISYLFYVCYIMGIMIHQLLYVGTGAIYLFEQDTLIEIVNNASLVVIFPILSLALFIKTFLHTDKYLYANKILNTFIIILPLSVILFSITDYFNKYRNWIPILLLIFLISFTIYAALKRNRQAYFILVGWCAIFLAIIFMFLSSIGFFDIKNYIPYYIEFSLIFEAVIFSIALSDRIKVIQAEKELADKKIIQIQKKDTEKLEQEVSKRTKELEKAYNEKKLLLKELHHRVKNNMQTIVSLIRLQKGRLKDEKLKDVLSTLYNRINAMNHVHTLLYKDDSSMDIDAHNYFELLIKDVQKSYEQDINITYDINTNLPSSYATYCGLIFNELVTNSFKHAFPNKKGNIYVKLFKKNKTFHLHVQDDGISYNIKETKDSLGMMLVNALAKQQLKGDITHQSDNGTKVALSWEER